MTTPIEKPLQLSLAAIVLTYNEEIHIGRCLRSLRGLCDEIFVIDSNSTDRTQEIARTFGAQILQNAFVSQAAQLKWALENINTRAVWMIRLDADEVIEHDLAEEIKSKLPQLDPGIAGVHLNRKHIFMNRWIRHGGRYPLHLLRIWRRGSATVEDRLMHEHMLVKGGRTIRFSGGFLDHNLHDITFFIEKHNRYATRQAVQILAERRRLPGLDSQPGLDLVGQAAHKRALKRIVYDSLPFPFGPLFYFLYRYIVQLGFLDGVEGLIYHFLQGFWYRFLVEAKLIELERAIPKSQDLYATLEQVKRLTGVDLAAR